jgi:glycosyltransferase involved in cell wall biosynthesis
LAVYQFRFVEEKVFIIEPLNKPVFIYIGAEDAVQKGAIGTHTAGIFNALSASGHFGRTIFIGGRPLLQANIPLNADENFLIDNTIAAASTIAGRMCRRFILLKKISAITKSLLKSHANSRVVVYTRYSLFVTFFLVLFLRRSLTRPNVLFVAEYNDISVDQLVFVNKYRASFIARFIRTNPAVLWFLGRSEAYIFSRSALVVVMTGKIKEYAQRLFKNSRVLVLPNAASAELVARAGASDKQALRKRLGLGPDLFYLAHIGTLTFWDGLDYLLRGINLCKNRDAMRLLVIGDGDALETIKKLTHELSLDECVMFYPPMPHHDAFDYLLASDVVPLLKTIGSYELSPIKFYETLAAGKPMICTDIPYINEVNGKKYGRVIGLPPQPAEVRDAIEYFYSQRQELDSWKNEIIDVAEKNHTWEIRVTALLDGLNRAGSLQGYFTKGEADE